MTYKSVITAAGTLRFLEEGTGPAVFVLHGAGVQASALSPMLKRLAGEYRVVAPDLPGFGWSFSPPSSWRAEDYAACVLDLAARLGVETFHVVGHSFGGAVALACAAAGPAVGRVVLIDPLALPPPFGRLRLLFRFFMVKTLHHALRPSHWLRMTGIVLCFLGGLFGKPGRFHGMTQLVLREVYRADRPIGRIAQPVAILWGDRDEVFPPAAAADLAGRLKSATVTVVRGGHDWCLMHEEEAARLVIEALRRR